MHRSLSRFVSRSQSPSDQSHRSLHDIRKELEDVRRRIENTVEEIEKANEALRELRIVEERLLQSAEEAARFLAPVERLPLDIIGNIVEHVTSSNIVISGSNDGIWPLTYVCSSWRNAILSLPRLWASFTVIGHLDNRHLRILSVILERSGSHPLSFYTRFSDERDTPESERMVQAAFMSILVEHSERWQNAHICTAVEPSVFLKIHKRLPILETLIVEFNIDWQRRWADSEAECRIFEYAPKLTWLDISSRWGRCPVQFRFPIQQLRELRSTWNCDARQVGPWDIEELPKFRSLVDLKIRQLGWRCPEKSAGDIIPPPIELPTVTHFGLTAPQALITAFSLPALTTLGLWDVQVDHQNLGGIQRLLSSPVHGQLRVFSMSLIPGADCESVEELLSHPALERVERLILVTEQRRPRKDWILPFLMRATYRPYWGSVGGGEPAISLAFLRHLSLKFNYEPGDRVILDALEDFITSRTNPADEMVKGKQKKGGGDLEGEDRSLPARLESIFVSYSELFPAITLENFRHHRLGMVGIY